MPHVQFDRYSLRVDGQRVGVRCAAIHYFRLPSQAMWLERLWQLKAAGYNTIDLYLSWSFHCPESGVYDFEGIRDVQRLFEITQELGLWVIARPGPYINAELSGGGLPDWLIAQPDVVLRNRKNGAHHLDETYMAAVRQWWEVIIPIIARQPNVLLVQVENEYSTQDMNPEYMDTLVRWTRELGVTVPLFHNDPFAFGCFADEVDIYAFDHYPVMDYSKDWRTHPAKALSSADGIEAGLRPYCPNRPLFVAELQSGWYSPWGSTSPEGIVARSGRELIRLTTKTLMAQGVTLFNHYMGSGGTNWADLGSTDSISSYDFAALIGENGALRPSYFEGKALNALLAHFPLTATEPVDSFTADTVQLADGSLLYRVRQVMSETPSTTEALDQSAHWLFLRNLDTHAKSTTLAGYPLQVPGLDISILPWQLPLASGHTLTLSTTELLYQDHQSLMVKGDRPVTLVLQDGQGHSTFVSFEPQAPNQSAVQTVDGLTIHALGAEAIDQLWITPDRLVSGATAWLSPQFITGPFGHTASVTPLCLSGPPASVKTVSFSTKSDEPPHKVPTTTQWRVSPLVIPPQAWQSIPVHSDESGLIGLNLDEIGLYEGTVCYRLTWPMDGPKPKRLELKARHLWQVRMAGNVLATDTKWRPPIGPTFAPATVSVDLPEAAWHTSSTVEVLVDFLGHPKGFFDDCASPGGLLQCLPQSHIKPTHIEIARISPTPQPPDPLAHHPQANPLADVWQAHCEFVTPQIGQLKGQLPSLQVVFPTPTKGLALFSQHPTGGNLGERVTVYLNGVAVGRYWAQSATQTAFYLPSGLLLPIGQRNQLTLVGLPLTAPHTGGGSSSSVQMEGLAKGLDAVTLQWANLPVALTHID